MKRCKKQPEFNEISSDRVSDRFNFTIPTNVHISRMLINEQFSSLRLMKDSDDQTIL